MMYGGNVVCCERFAVRIWQCVKIKILKVWHTYQRSGAFGMGASSARFGFQWPGPDV